jgi:hypothetical protein
MPVVLLQGAAAVGAAAGAARARAAAVGPGAAGEALFFIIN